MKAKLGPVSLRLFLGVALLLMSILSFGGPATSAAATGPLQNPGFEGGVNPTTGAPLYWTVVSAPDAVKVVGTEGPADFPTYADANNGDIAGDITVSPYKGDLMLRLGSPKRIAESQNTGRNTVSQTFTPSRDTLKFSFRLFSWESRGRDVFSFNLTKANRSSVGTLVPFNITMPSGTTVGCSALPCQFTIDVGKQGQFLDSGWREVEIQDVPTNVGDLTLTYTAGGTENNAHATWAYFDNVNTPPVARFSFDPSSPLEGGRIRFLDQSYDLDPDDAVVSWQWTVQGPLERGLYRKADLVSFRYLFDNSESPWVSQNPSFIAPENGTYVVKLTVTDTYGASTTVLSGAIATDGVVMSQLLVGNTPPLVNALNIEVREGDSALLIGRFLDHGFMDLHNAVWVLPGGDTVPATVQEEHRAFLTAGLVTGQIPWATLQAALGGATELQGAMLRVTEYEGGTASGEDQFTISVLPNDINDREPNNDQASAVALPSDWVYSSYLQSQGDIDVFEITRSDGSPLPAGSEVLVNLKDLPADYDLVLLTQSPGDAGSLQQAYFDMTTFDMTLFDMTLFDMTLFDMTLFDMTTFDMTLFDMTTFDMTLFDMTTFDMTPLSGQPFTGLGAGAIGGSDIGLGELGLSNIITGNTSVAGFSANRGTDGESLLATVDTAGTRVFAVVIGANGAYSTEPYSLQVEFSVPFKPLVAGESLVSSHTYTTDALIQNTSPKTLFVTQRERMQALYPGSWDSLLADLTALASHPSVLGDIISVPSIIYEPWDLNPASVDEANTVSSQIRTIIQDYLNAHPSIEFVVLVGSDDVIPHRRVPDETNFNERMYALNSFLKWGSPLLSSMLAGQDLTDDYYVDARPISWQGRELYVPDLPLGRLVETPQEIRAAAQAFIGSNGVLQPQTALVTGYDFFADGASVAGDYLDDLLSTTRLLDDNWDMNSLRTSFLGQGGTAPDVVYLNAHFAHYAALTAKGFTQGISDFLSSREVAEATGSPTALFQRLVFTIGCHAGLNVPDRSSEAVDPGLGINPALDFVQAMAQQRAIYVASTGFGVGDDEGLGGTEKLLSIYARELMQGGANAGQALVNAKQLYLSSLSAMTVYDEKSSIQTTLYGLPMYQIKPTSASFTAAAATSSTGGNLTLTINDGTSQTTLHGLSMYQIQAAGVGAAAVASSSTGGNLTLTINDGTSSSTTNHSLQLVTTPSGSYYTADGDAQATADRAIQPRVVTSLASNDSGPVHGVMLTNDIAPNVAATFSDTSEFDPLIARPTIEWERDAEERQICLPSFWPSELASVNSLETGDGLMQTLVVVPGQFRCDSDSAPTVTGIQRLYSSLSFDLLRFNSSDWQPPQVSGIELREVDYTTVDVTVHASDPSNVVSIVVLQIGNGTAISTSSGPLSGPGPYTVRISNFASGNALMVQVADGAGNVSTATGKGANLSVIRVSVEPTATVDENRPVSLRATLPDFINLAAPVFYIWNFGDGTSVSGQTTNGTIDVSHVYPDDNPTGTPTDQYVTQVKVMDSAGGIGTATIIVTVEDIAPVVTALSTTSPINENDMSTLNGSFSDVGVLDTHTVRVNWGDGSPAELATITQGAGSGTFTASHRYLDDNPSGTPQDNYTVTVFVTDDDTRIGTASFAVTVKNVPPSNIVVSVSPSTIDENGSTTLSGTFSDPGTKDTHTVDIGWGDGSPNTTISLGSNVLTFSASHQYLDDNPTATASDVYNISVTVTDDDTGVGSAATTVVVNNVAPTVTATGSTINENGTAAVSGTISDPGTKDSFTIAIAWGLSEGSTVLSLPAGSTFYSAAHQYLDDNPTGTASDVYNISVTVTDDDTGVGSATTTVVVNNVAPVVEAGPDQTVPWGGVVSLAPASFTDVGTRDTYTATINWGDGTTTNVVTVTSTISGSHTYAVIGQHTVTVTVTDDDGASASDTFVVTVLCTDSPGDIASGVNTSADLLGCDVSNDATTMTMVVRVAGPISSDFQYRIKLDINGDGVFDYNLRYYGGKVTGLPSLQAFVNGSELRFTFNLADIGRGSGNYIRFYAETQAGVAATPDVGIADKMPDSGLFGYVLR